ncbi:MAG TPA: pseudouridine synthase [Gaiellales bacterium]|nr:pseudouridine synthase [Gaiellales bacterium]
MPVRLNRYLASAGVGSRRAVDELIRAGRVTVNGEVGELGAAVGDDDVVAVDGRTVAPQELAYLMLHKPSGVVTTASDPQRRRTVVDLVESPERVYPVGRLDRDTTGLLLLTNDGELANRLAHPRQGVDKTYVVEVEGDPPPEAIRRLEEGVELDDGPTAPARARRLGAGRLELVIHEGRNRQVRRMCEAVGHPVRRLHRTAYGPLELDTLAPGSWRPLTAEEVAALRPETGS